MRYTNSYNQRWDSSDFKTQREAEIHEAVSETEVEIVLQRGRAGLPGVSPRIVSCNGSQYIARDFKEFIRMNGMTQVRARHCVWRMAPPQGSRQHERTCEATESRH